ncbi:MAG: cytochrome b/b6 domain-containing protein [Bauldia sp.]
MALQREPQRTQSSEGYRIGQIGLHWLIAALVLFQLAFGESMGEVVEEAEEAGRAPDLAAVLAQPHYWVGVAVLVLALVRLALRLRSGVPAAPVNAPPWTVTVAAITHGLFYLLLLVVPITGLLAVHVSDSFATAHVIAKPAFVVLILLHVIGGLYHQFVLADGTLRRMFVPARRGG